MAAYRARASDGVAWITGASSGIGRQLARDLSGLGWTVAASARGSDELERLSAEATGSGGRIVPVPCDVTDAAACAAAVDRIEAEIGPIALAVLNAGTYLPARGEKLDTALFERTFAVNLLGTTNALVPVVQRMKARRRGQVAVTGSLTAYFGLPSAAAYGASKAAINGMAQSLRFDLEKLNIRIQVINPGFVETPLTAKNDFFMPGLMPVEKASARIVAGLQRGGFEIAFPRRLAVTMRAVANLPHGVRHAFVRWFTGWGKRPLKE
ncbi:MAG: SDR family NAD(P)-dependent oxidoreductase [Rhizobiaceae bacterium]|nr:SDR family NAD(P)-dependent oxidoreductase [Rhizobiaceae bacterium]